MSASWMGEGPVDESEAPLAGEQDDLAAAGTSDTPADVDLERTVEAGPAAAATRAASRDDSSEDDLDDDLTPAEELQELLEVIAEALALDTEIVIEEGDGTLSGTLEGEDLGVFIGRHGQTIEAVQHLAQRIVLRGGGGTRVIVDAAGYRDRRFAMLRAQADRAAEAALREGRAVALEPLASTERRYVHEYLRERGDVETHSEGDEPDRRLVVEPAAR